MHNLSRHNKGCNATWHKRLEKKPKSHISHSEVHSGWTAVNPLMLHAANLNSKVLSSNRLHFSYSESIQNDHFHSLCCIYNFKQNYHEHKHMFLNSLQNWQCPYLDSLRGMGSWGSLTDGLDVKCI